MSTSGPGSRSSHWRACLLVALLLQCLGTVALADRVRVELQGLSGEELANAQASLSIWQVEDDGLLDAEAINELHERAPAEIRRALEPFGYYRPQVTGDLSPPEAESADWYARYTVDPGDRVSINELDLRLDGIDAENQEILSESLTLASGLPLDHRQYESDKQQLLAQVRLHLVQQQLVLKLLQQE